MNFNYLYIKTAEFLKSQHTLFYIELWHLTFNNSFLMQIYYTYLMMKIV